MKPGGRGCTALYRLPGSPDAGAAQEVANHLGTVITKIRFTVQEGLDAIRDVIYHIKLMM
ncbi:asparagine synthase-related protein [Shigella flexneri]